MWKITKEFELNEFGEIYHTKDVNITSKDFTENVELIERFRLLDGDGYVYFEGVSNDSETDIAFAPLDDFGEPDSGCVEIQYFRDGKWETL